MISIVEIFGAPVIEPQGKREPGLDQVNSPGRAVSMVEVICQTVEYYRLGKDGLLVTSNLRNPVHVIAEEADDHHVFCSIFRSLLAANPLAS